jgi:hypothetical protein
VASVDTVCIQVAHPSGTFLAGRDFVVTHNSGLFSSVETSSNQAFIRRQMMERDEMEEWAKWHFFEPLARWNNLKIKKGDALVPVIPELLWEKTLDYAAEEANLKAAQMLWDKGVYPTKRLLTKNRENPDEIEQELKEEIGTVFDDGKRISAPSIRAAGAVAKPLGGGGGGRPAAGGGGGAGAEEGGGGAGAGGGGGETAGVGEAAAGEGPAMAEGATPAAGAGGGGEEGGEAPTVAAPEIL